jgi:hypothetical protein
MVDEERLESKHSGEYAGLITTEAEKTPTNKIMRATLRIFSKVAEQDPRRPTAKYVRIENRGYSVQRRFEQNTRIAR